VRTVTLDRPERLNAIDMPMIVELEAALADAMADDAVNAILLRGAGRSFCAGDDVNAQTEICARGEAAVREQLVLLQRISEHLTLGSKPTVAAVRGWAVGAGFSWALNCDLSIWSEQAGGFLPEVAFGAFVSGGATLLLPQTIGRQRANQMLYRGLRVRAPQALDWGLASSVSPEETLDADALALTSALAALPPLAARSMKRAVTDAWADDFRRALDRETQACLATTLHPATLARMRKAIEKDR
jgi:enoyl-CoA hydratase/carnithine racemase